MVKEEEENAAGRELKNWSAIVMTSMCCLAYGILIITLALFAFNSADPSTCFYMKGFDVPATKKSDLLDLAKDLKMATHYDEERIVDMARVFHLWFKIGFWACLGTLIMAFTAATAV